MISYTAKEQFSYVPKADRELAPELQTKFHLRTLSSEEDDPVMTLQAAADARWANTALRFGLLGWENFKDVNGKPLTFKLVAGVPSSETLDLVKEIRFELAGAIRERGMMAQADEKN